MEKPFSAVGYFNEGGPRGLGGGLSDDVSECESRWKNVSEGPRAGFGQKSKSSANENVYFRPF